VSGGSERQPNAAANQPESDNPNGHRDSLAG